MEQTPPPRRLFIMADAVMVKAISDSSITSDNEKLQWIETYIKARIEPWEHELFCELLLKRMKRLNAVEVD